MAVNLTHAEHFQWMEAVLAAPSSTFTHAQKTVLLRLALHRNLKTGRCDPSIEIIAAGSALSSRAVQATFVRAEEFGWLTRLIGGGRGNTTSYSLRLGGSFASEETLHSDAAFTETLHGQTTNDNAEKGAPPSRKPCTSMHPNTENKKNTDSKHDFDRWYCYYPKHRSRATARNAFERVLKEGKATVEELIAGAKRYAAERAGQSTRYTLDPATWLNGECWADEPVGDHTEERSKFAATSGGRTAPRL
jgi:hypothetical protein